MQRLSGILGSIRAYVLAIHTERSARKKRELVIHHQSITRVDETNDQKRIRRQSHHMLKKGIA